jgi:hypothetical protein
MLLCGLHVGCLLAQSSSRVAPMSTRGALEAQLRKADSLHLTDEAFNLRRRLRSGDFEVGDRIHLVFQTTGSLTALGLSQIDTVIVQAGKMIIFPPPIDSISLDGVLFSELTSAINVRVSKYFKDVVVRAVPLMRLSVTGAIARPGYYYFPTDSPLSDLLMRGGGQGPGSDMPKSAIRRGSRVVWTGADVQTALADGTTIEALGLRPGDELVVAEKKQRSWVLPAIQVGATVLTLFIALTHTR